ncbi:YkvA family protein [Desulforamulus ferrireducens]|uniref:DUF1232 domain-containing protein n=1 Tax=Desulforamulus ferrireducens TaxID=1833852 RepID=A0A1S6ITU8_9FIRM|nr:YkvA family protein [Desulforamulus ferrireducens]AQS58198.1 hypothetical protein B0537_03260 [Desulforamulus ferrireducens]
MTVFKKILFFIQALLNPAVPSRMKYEMGACLLYFISPIDFVPDFIPITGKADDIVILFWGCKRVFDVLKLHRQSLALKSKEANGTP